MELMARTMRCDPTASRTWSQRSSSRTWSQRSSDEEDGEDIDSIFTLFDEEGALLRTAEMERTYGTAIDWLPHWARPRKVMALALEAQAKGIAVPLGLVAGQAIPIVVTVTVVRCMFQISLVILTAKVATCDNSTGEASYSLELWPAALSVECLFRAVELLAFSYVAIPKAQILGIPRTCGRSWPFDLWIVMRCFFSLVTSVDFTTDSLFLGVSWGTQSCVAGRLVEAKWKAIYYDTIWDPILLPYAINCLLAYAINLVPVMFALLFSVVRDPEWCPNEDQSSEERRDMRRRFSYEAPWTLKTENIGLFSVAESGELEREETPWIFHKNTVGAPKHNHGEALMSLAEASGMRLVVGGDFKFAQRKAELALCEFLKELRKEQEDRQGQGEEAGDMIQDGSETELCKKLLLAVDHIHSQVRRGVLHLLFCGALSNGFQVLLQITSLEITNGANSFNMEDFQTITALCFSFFSLLARSTGAIFLTYESWTWMRKFYMASSLLRSQLGLDLGRAWDQKLRRFGCCFSLLVVTCLLCLFQICNALLKLRGLWCPYSIFAVASPFRLHSSDGPACWYPCHFYINQCELILNETAAERPVPLGFNQTLLHQAWCV